MDTCDVRVVVIGHVDHGKSTLIGRLLFEAGAVADEKRAQLEAVARRRGTAFEWANLMDALQLERDQNVTVDTAQIWLRDGGRSIVLIDAPGHREFVKNMVTGAASADAAILVLDVQEGVREQSRRHAHLLTLLGVPQVAAVVNKMDAVGYDETAFQAVAADLRAFLTPLGFESIPMIPASAREGDNLVRPSERLGWYRGPTVIDALRGFNARVPATDAPLRLPVQDVYRFDHRRVIAGRIESGRLAAGDRVAVSPGGRESTVESFVAWSRPAPESASAGQSIALTLADDLFVERGVVLSSRTASPHEAKAFGAKVFWLGRRPLVFGHPYTLKLATQEVGCTVDRAGAIVDGSTLDPIEGRVDHVASNEVADVLIRTVKPIAIDLHHESAALGRFVIVDQSDIAGGGIVTRLDAAPATTAPLEVRVDRLVTQTEREARAGHRGAVVWFTGLSGAGKSTIANSLERALFDRGHQVFVLDGDNIRLGLSADLGFSVADRSENIRRIAEVAKLFAESGAIAITAFISPYASDRLRARRIMSQSGLDLPFVEVHVDAPLAVCEARDPKGLYAKARDGRIKQFTGVSDPYEPPDHPEVVLHTAEQTIDASVDQLLTYLQPVITRR